jgi:phosphopantetheinyl transferase
MNPAIVAYVPLPDQLPPAIAAQLRAAVPYGRRMRLPAAGAPAAASLLGIALARVLLGELLSAPPASITLQFPYRAKPVSPGGADFSLSHSGAWLAGIACASGRVGLDIEARAPESSGTGTAGRDLADWTAREAAVKARGTSLEEVRDVQVYDSHCLWQQQRWLLARPQVPEGLVAAVVSEEPLTVSVRWLSWETLVGRVIAPGTQMACA